MLTVDNSSGTLVVSDGKRAYVRCLVSDLRLSALRQPFFTTDFTIVADASGSYWIEFHLRSCTMLGLPSRSVRPGSDRCNLTGRIMEMFPSVMTPAPSFSALIEIKDHPISLLIFQGQACALECRVKIGAAFTFYHTMPISSSNNTPTFILDDDSDAVFIDYIPCTLQSIDDILIYNKDTTLVSIVGRVIVKNVDSVQSGIHDARLLLLYRVNAPRNVSTLSSPLIVDELH